MNPELLDRLRADLTTARYEPAEIRALIGSAADESRERGAFALARYELAERERSALGELIHLFLLGSTLDPSAVSRAFPTLGISGAEQLEIIVARGGGFRAAVSVNTHEFSLPEARETGSTLKLWIISDLDDQLRSSPAPADHVMGVGGATRSLLMQAPPVPHRRSRPLSALDLGTGCGAIALVLAGAGYDRVVATDISARALRFARANAQLNRLEERIEFRHGDLFEPVAGDAFDLILSNPPFVITPRGSDVIPQYHYRDGGASGDELISRVVGRSPQFLHPGGTLLCLGNWESPWGGNGLERVRSWVEEASQQTGPLAAWIIERDRVDPARYAETWIRDGGVRPGSPDFDALLHEWIQDFSRRRIVAVGLGSIRVQRLPSDSSPNTIRVEHIAEPFGEDAARSLQSAFLAGVAAARMGDEELLDTHWQFDPSVVEVREHTPGAEAPRALALRTREPFHRAVMVDPMLSAAVGACDGELTLQQISDALATLLEADGESVRRSLCDEFRELCWLGVLTGSER